MSTAWDSKEVPIIRTADVTITGTRNGLPTILLYESIREGIQPLKKIADICWSRTNYLKKLLEKKNIDYYCRPTSITVSFQQPSQLLCKKYQLATKGNKSHVICLPHVSEEILDQFVEQLNCDL